MTDLIDLLRAKKLKVIYDIYYDKNWSDEELLNHVIILDCSNNGLTFLPDLPNCRELNCSTNKLTKLPHLLKCEYLCCCNNILQCLTELPLCKFLNCSHCQLEVLPELPNCETLYCLNNKLTYLPQLLKCHELICCYNKITYLPRLYHCIKLDCSYNKLTIIPELLYFCYISAHNNLLPFNDVYYLKKIWKFRKFYLGLKYLRLLYKKMLLIKARKKYELHLELKYSPNLPFYKEDSYYKHFIENQ